MLSGRVVRSQKVIKGTSANELEPGLENIRTWFREDVDVYGADAAKRLKDRV